jgi:[CysO sulfur-carrier protein]-S-L-cysteine hydrolase
MKSLILPVSIHSKIISNLEKHLPEEACGLITGKGNLAKHHFSITNGLHSPYRYLMEGSEMLHVFEWSEKHDQMLLGIYHSHPNGPENPSLTDLEEDYYPDVIKLIGSKSSTQWELKAYLNYNSGYLQIPLVIK